MAKLSAIEPQPVAASPNCDFLTVVSFRVDEDSLYPAQRRMKAVGLIRGACCRWPQRPARRGSPGPQLCAVADSSGTKAWAPSFARLVSSSKGRVK